VAGDETQGAARETWRGKKALRGHLQGASTAAGPLFFFFHRDRHGTDRRQANLVSFDVRNEAAVDKVVVTLVTSLAAVPPGQLDAVAFDPIDRADVNTIGPDDFHMLLDFGHVIPLVVC
jgi:hypothetical protein